MNLYKIEKEEETIIRKVTRFGNGAHVFAPKRWLNSSVALVRIPTPSLMENILKILYPYLEHIIAAFLYGSYARNEQTEDSDIDLFIVADKKIKIKAEGKFDIIVIEKSRLEAMKRNNPLIFYAILSEAKPIINSSLLHELWKKKIALNSFKDFIETTKTALSINKEFLELDKIENDTYLSSYSVVYSAILRLRGMFIIRQLIKKERFSNELFKRWVMKKIPFIDFDNIYEVYRAVRNKRESRIKKKISIKDVEALLNVLEKEIKNA